MPHYLTPIDLLLDGQSHCLPICKRCKRRGRYSLKSIIDQHGTDVNMAEWLSLVAKDCPKYGASLYERCQVFDAWRKG